LNEKFEVPCIQTGLPIGIVDTDKFFSILENLSGNKTPEIYLKERGRLIDSYIDGHKILFGKRAILYGEEDFVIALAHFLSETGIKVVLAISGGNSKTLAHHLGETLGEQNEICTVSENADFEDLADLAKQAEADIMIGNSKGYYIARNLNIPLIRTGFPIHDRFGSQRINHLGYKGTQELYDRIANALLEYKQENSSIGYKYL
jgi:nitrogenase molybdenum-iron protein NifN